MLREVAHHGTVCIVVQRAVGEGPTLRRARRTEFLMPHNGRALTHDPSSILIILLVLLYLFY